MAAITQRQTYRYDITTAESAYRQLERGRLTESALDHMWFLLIRPAHIGERRRTSHRCPILALATRTHLLASASISAFSRFTRCRGTCTRVEASTVKVSAKKTGSVLSSRAARLARKVGRCRHGVRGYTYTSAKCIRLDGYAHSQRRH
jgi:hypothetical protein